MLVSSVLHKMWRFQEKIIRHTKNNETNKTPPNALPRENIINTTRLRYDTNIITNQCNLK